MLEFEFTVVDWAAYAAGLTEKMDWLAWAARSPQLPAFDAQAAPPLIEMPAMMRRRLDRVGRFACQVAWWCQQRDDSAPMVFASRYGDSERSLGLLGELVQGEPLSPTGFGLSVHNAISALYGIARGHTGNTIAVCAGRATVGAALTEAAALLADGAPEVLVVFYETPLPSLYTAFEDEDLAEYAWCWRVAKPAASGPRTRVSVGTEGTDSPRLTTDTAPSTWPSGLAVLRHVLQQMPAPASPMRIDLRRHDRAGTEWKWGMHA
ncbi:MAG: beta-ketoacyl synthase chain length factor [Rhodoferax sp.]|nr:beta-ketoacyl synthase chain length factor [Rhodoferax sp.]